MNSLIVRITTKRTNERNRIDAGKLMEVRRLSAKWIRLWAATKGIALEKVKNIDSFRSTIMLSHPNTYSPHPSYLIHLYRLVCFLACLPNEFHAPREVKFTEVRLP